MRTDDQPALDFPIWADHSQTVVVDPVTGVSFVELSHVWGTHTPVYPGYPDIVIRRAVSQREPRRDEPAHRHRHAQRHARERAGAPDPGRPPGSARVPVDRFFGSGVVLGIEKGEWELVEPADLEAAGIEVFPGDIVIVNTGWHRRYADSQEYFGEGPGLSEAAARWLIDKGVKLAGVDTASIDHPMATSLGRHRGGPIVKALPKRYEERRGRKPEDDFRTGSRLTGLCSGPASRRSRTWAATSTRSAASAAPSRPCRSTGRAANASIVRLVAILDPSGDYRLESGEESD